MRAKEVKKIDKGRGVYKKIVLEKGKIVGAIVLGDGRGVARIKKLMDQKTDVTEYKDLLLEEGFDYRRILLWQNLPYMSHLGFPSRYSVRNFANSRLDE